MKFNRTIKLDKTKQYNILHISTATFVSGRSHCYNGSIYYLSDINFRNYCVRELFSIINHLANDKVCKVSFISGKNWILLEAFNYEFEIVEKSK